MNQGTLNLALRILVQSPQLIQQFGLLPNVKLQTMGGDTWWNDLARHNGWRVQRNTWTGHCRILDEDNVRQAVRQAWGSEQAVMAFFHQLISGQV